MDELKEYDVVPDGYAYPVYADMGKLHFNITSALPTFKSILQLDQTYLVVCRGTSGICIAQLLTILLPEYRLEIKYQKKDTEVNHGHGYTLNSYLEDPIIVVDDFISSGMTMRTIAKGLGVNCANVQIVFACALAEFKPLIKELFPNTKHLIY